MNSKLALQTLGSLSVDDAKRDLEPFNLGDMKTAILAAAGFTPDNMAGILQAAVGTLVETLQATKVTYFQKDGEVTDMRVDPDGQLRARAATELASLVKSIGGLQTDTNQKNNDSTIVVQAAFMNPSAPVDTTTPQAVTEESR